MARAEPLGVGGENLAEEAGIGGTGFQPVETHVYRSLRIFAAVSS
jgi:hypothetical protein